MTVLNTIPCVAANIPVVSFAGGLTANEVPAEMINFCKLMVEAQHARHPDLYYIDQYEIRKGKKYFKIDRLNFEKETGKQLSYCSAVCSIDEAGNVYKPAGYNGVAKGIRGNIFERDGSGALSGGYIRYFR